MDIDTMDVFPARVGLFDGVLFSGMLYQLLWAWTNVEAGLQKIYHRINADGGFFNDSSLDLLILNVVVHRHAIEEAPHDICRTPPRHRQ